MDASRFASAVFVVPACVVSCCNDGMDSPASNSRRQIG